MGLFSKFKEVMGLSKDLNVEEFMSIEDNGTAVDVVHKPKGRYVKPLALQNDGDVTTIKDELSQGHIVLLNISLISKNPNKLKAIVSDLKAHAKAIDGDIARIDDDKVLLTPNDVGIIKKRH